MKRRIFLTRSMQAAALGIVALTGLGNPGRADGNNALLLLNDKITPRILIAPTATESEKYAAQELSIYLTKMTGRTVESVTSLESLEATAQSPLIVVGHHALNAHLKPATLELEESIVEVKNHRVHIVGGALPPVTGLQSLVYSSETVAKETTYVQDRGTLYGVYNLLDELGVRWYRPEAWGEHVPQRKQIVLPPGKKSYKPGYLYRWGVDIYRWYADQTPQEYEMMQTWMVRNRINVRVHSAKLGGGYVLYIIHNYDYLLPNWKYFKEHPEYFALINGQRIAHGQPCMGNPAVQRIMAQRAIEVAKEARKNPSIKYISLEPNDGLNFCECELCRAMDDPALLAKNGADVRVGNASMANRVSLFNNAIAKRVKEEVPEIGVTWLAYLAHSEVPTKIDKLESNVLIVPATMAAAYGDYSKLLYDPNSGGNKNFLEVLEGYGKMAPMLVYEYWSGGSWYGPLPLLTVMKDRLSNYRKYGVVGAYSEFHPSWGPQSINYYFYTRLLWNPELDMEQALEEYCRDYYGPSAEPMRKYHLAMEKASLSGTAWFSLGYGAHRIFTKELVVELTPLINQAKALVKGQQPYERRIEGDWSGYEVARMVSLIDRYKQENNPFQAVATAEALQQFIRADKTGEFFNSGPEIFKGTWNNMASIMGIGAMYNQLATLKANPNAALLQNLSEGWKFSTDPKNEGLQKGVTTSYFSDRTWHDINANATWQEQGHNYLGTAWYRKSFELAKKEEGKKYALFFGAVDGDAIIYLNGREVGKHLLGPNGEGWENDFFIDITQGLKEGKNTLVVQVKKTMAVAGIYKGVTLMQM